jgi:hypothetical protein
MSSRPRDPHAGTSDGAAAGSAAVTTAGTSPRSSTGALLALLALVCAAALWVRSVHDQRIANVAGEPARGWFSPDPDSLYQMRRVERALDEGLPPAERDPRMNAPHGASIPWPPYYAWVAYAATAPFAPEAPAARKPFIEQRVASLPRIFGALTSTLVALVTWRVLRRSSGATRAFGAALAGVLHAFAGASLAYSSIGNGDHHAWVTLLLTALFGGALHALDEVSLEQRARSMRHGVLLGLVAGALVGSWVGGLVYVALLELGLGLALIAHARRPRAGLPALGLALHLAWALAVAPAVLSSPWKHEQPWMMVNLSWLHLAHPLLGALVFAPLVARPNDAALRARWPALVSALLAFLCAALAFGEFALARSVREGFAWASRNNTFMAFISESQPLAWGQIGSWTRTVQHLSFGVVLAPLAVAWLAWRARKDSRLDLALLALALPPLTVQAFVQQRFGDALAPLFAISLAVSLAAALSRWSSKLGRERAWLAAALGAALGLALQAPTLARLPERLAHPWHGVDPLRADLRARRELYRWLAAQPAKRENEAVLASWDHGHALEWAAERASVGTNFGSYVGEDSYLDPWRFFLEDDPRAAEAKLVSRAARYVLITGDFSKDLEVMLRLLRPEERRSYLLIPEQGPVWASQRFFPTLAARLMMNGRVGDMERRALVGPSLDFLRLVHVSPSTLQAPLPVRHTNSPVPVGWIWEHVVGAQVEASGAPGESLAVEIELEYAAARQSLKWIGEAPVGADGSARVRVPYATDAPNGDGVARGPARWRVGGRSGSAAIPARAVEGGERVQL